MEFRRSGGTWHRRALEPAGGDDDVRYFEGGFPELRTGDQVEYVVKIRCGGARFLPERRVGDPLRFRVAGQATAASPPLRPPSAPGPMSTAATFRAGSAPPPPTAQSPLPGLAAAAGRTPDELREAAPALFAELRARADAQLRSTLAAIFADASPGVRELVARLDFEGQDQRRRDPRQALEAAFRGEGVSQELAREGLSRILGSEGTGLVDDPLQPEVMLGSHPLVEAELGRARTALLGATAGLSEAKIKAVLERGVTAATISDQALEALVAEGELDDGEASRLGLTAGILALTGDDGLTETLRTRRFASLEHRPAEQLRDLARLTPDDWQALMTEIRPEPPAGLDASEQAGRLRKAAAALYPTEALLSSLPKGRPERVTVDLEQLQALHRHNSVVLGAASFDALDTSELTAVARQQARSAYEQLKGLANSYPGLGLHELLDDPELGPDAKLQHLRKRLDWLTLVQQQNPGVELLALDYSAGSSDLAELNLDGLAPSEQQMVVGTLKAYQRTYAVTVDVDDARAILAAGYHAAVAIARDSPVDFARATGLPEAKAIAYHSAARTKANAIATSFGAVLEVVADGTNGLNLANFGPPLENFLRNLPGYEELFGSQAYCRCRHCQSVLGPAAYFVDLMRFVDKHVLSAVFASTRASHVLNLKQRRPELWTLPLTCRNTDELIPTLEVVNEILENYIALRRGYQGPLTNRTAIELLVYEQHVGKAIDSFWQPFLLPLEKLHIYLAHFDRSLAAIARTLEAPAAVIAAAELKLSKREYELITQPDTTLTFLENLYGMQFQVQGGVVSASDVQPLLRPMGLTRGQLDELLSTHFVNPPGAAKVEIRAEKRDQTSVQNDIERIYGLTPAALDRTHRFTRLWRRSGWTMTELDVVLESLAAVGLAQGVDTDALNGVADLLALQRRFKTSVEETLALWGSVPDRPVAAGSRSLFGRLFNLPPFERLDGPLPRPTVSFVHPSLRQGGAAAPADNTLNRLLAGLRVSDENLTLLITHLAAQLGANPTAANENDRGFLLTKANLDLLYSHARLAERLQLPIADLFQLLDHLDRAGVQAFGLSAVLEWADWQKASGWSLDDLGFITGGRVLRPADYPGPAQTLMDELLDGIRTDNALVFADTVLAYLPDATEDDARQVIAANSTSIEAAPDGGYRLAASFDPAVALTIPTNNPIRAADAVDELLRYHASRVVPNRLAARLDLPSAKVDALIAMLGVDLNSPALALALHGDGPVDDLVELVDRLVPLAVLFRREVFDPAALDFIRTHNGAAGFGISDFRQVTLAGARRVSVYAGFIDTARQARFTPAQPAVDPLDLRQVLDDFDQTAGFANADGATLARVLRAEQGLVRTLLPSVSLSPDAPGALRELASVVEVARYLGVGGEALRLMLSDKYADLVRASDAVLGAFRAKYSDESQWQEKAEPYDDRLRSRRRDALADYLIHSIHPEFDSREDLYHHFLIDVSLEGCARTSRLVAAISSIQLYVHRCLMNLEQDGREPTDPEHVAVDPRLIPSGEWAWRRNYRVWEANRRVFLHAESFIEPGLRDDKSPLFEQLESTLLQQEINEQTVLDAYAAYMSGFEEIARLKIAGAFHEKNAAGRTDVVHLFGATPEDPPRYYYRTGENVLYGETDDDRPTSWSPWRRLDLQIPVRKVAPIVHRNKLHVFWTEISTSIQNQVTAEGSKFVGYKHTLLLKYTSLRLDGTWTAPQKVTFGVLGGITGDGAVLDPLHEPSEAIIHHQVPKYDNKVHLEPLDGYTLTGYRWEQVYPSTANSHPTIPPTIPGPHLVISIGSEILPMPGFDVGASNSLDLYRNRLVSELVDWQYADIAGMLYATTTGGAYRLRSYSRSLPTAFAYVVNAFHKDEFQLLGRGWQRSWINSFESYLDPLPLLGLRSGVEFSPVNGTTPPYGGLLDVQGDLLLLTHVASDTTFPFVLRRIGTTLDERIAATLFTGGVDALLATSHQLGLAEDATPVQVLNRVRNESNAGKLDFTGPNGVYYREIFFHIPFLIADHLNSQRRFAAAQRWYHYLFDPTAADPQPAGLTDDEQAQWRRDRPWRYREFRNRTLPALRELLSDDAAIATYRRDPFNPHAIARLRLSAYQKSVVMKYIDNLLDWGDSLFAQFTTESLNEATLLYVMAADILGQRPAQLGDCGEDRVRPRDYATIGPLMKEDSDFLIEFESLYVALGHHHPLASGRELSFRFTPDPAVLSAARPAAGATRAGANGSAVGGRTVAGVLNAYGWHAIHTTGWARWADQQAADVDTPVKAGITPLAGHDSPAVVDFARAPDFGLDLVSQISPVFCVPPNTDLLAYWDRVEDRLRKLRNCMDISGATRLPALFAPQIDPRLLVRARAAGLTLEDVLNAISGDLPPYRFSYLIDRAKAFTGGVQGFGAALLSALEKKDAEELHRLQTVQQQNMLKLTTQVREWELKTAEEGVELVDRQYKAAQYRYDHFQGLLEGSLSTAERIQQISRHAASVSQILADILSGTAGVLHLIPQLGSPFAMKYGGVELGGSAEGWAAMLRDTARVAEIIGGSAGLEATFQRRAEEWEHQRDLASHELAQQDKQLVLAEIRRDIAQRSLELHQRSSDQLEELFDFYADKFSNLELYTWLASTLQRVYRDAYNTAFAMARLAEQAYRFERGDDSASFLGGTYWDPVHAGLLAGEQLLNDLQTMERRFIETNYRSLEITQAFSLMQVDPAALIALREKASCEFLIGEPHFDLLYPGQYRRRISSVRLTIPCVRGPYTNVSATLTLLDSFLRNKPQLGADGLKSVPPRRSVAVAASRAQEDAGVFDFSFRDERYMPFEGAGAVSRWRLELPDSFRQFEYRTISDVILHISYTAEHDGLFRAEVEDLQDVVEGQLLHSLQHQALARVLNLRQEFPNAFPHLLYNPVGTPVRIEVDPRFFPIFLHGRTMKVTRAVVALELADGQTATGFAMTVNGKAVTGFDTDPGLGDLATANLGDLLAGGPMGTYTFVVTNPGELAPTEPPPNDLSALDEAKLRNVLLYLEYTVT
jgi:hypothetical protein